MQIQRAAWDLLPRQNTFSLPSLRRYPFVIFAASIFVVSVFFYGRRYPPFQGALREPNPPSRGTFNGYWNFERDARNLQMNNTQCDLAFPDLYAEIDRAVELRKNQRITLKEVEFVRPIRGYNRAMIYDNQVHSTHMFSV